MNLIQQAIALREGGATSRCHTRPHIGEYNVAMHSYNALSLLLLLSPTPPRIELIEAVLWHDVPERWTGDTPAPAKWGSPLLKRVLDNLEQKVLEKIGLGELFKNLTTQEKLWLNAVDLLELFLWANEQVKLGNTFAQDIISRVVELFQSRGDDVPKEVQNFLFDFEWKNTPELHELLGEQENEQSE